MRDVWIEMAVLALGVCTLLVLVVLGAPTWNIAVISFLIGGNAVLVLADYRDVLRQRVGLLPG